MFVDFDCNMVSNLVGDLGLGRGLAATGDVGAVKDPGKQLEFSSSCTCLC